MDLQQPADQEAADETRAVHAHGRPTRASLRKGMRDGFGPETFAHEQVFFDCLIYLDQNLRKFKLANILYVSVKTQFALLGYW